MSFFTVSLSQGLDKDVSAMQLANPNLTPVANIGAASWMCSFGKRARVICVG